jgi:hypothetical protein
VRVDVALLVVTVALADATSVLEADADAAVAVDPLLVGVADSGKVRSFSAPAGVSGGDINATFF